MVKMNSLKSIIIKIAKVRDPVKKVKELATALKTKIANLGKEHFRLKSLNRKVKTNELNYV